MEDVKADGKYYRLCLMLYIDDNISSECLGSVVGCPGLCSWL